MSRFVLALSAIVGVTALAETRPHQQGHHQKATRKHHTSSHHGSREHTSRSTRNRHASAESHEEHRTHQSREAVNAAKAKALAESQLKICQQDLDKAIFERDVAIFERAKATEAMEFLLKRVDSSEALLNTMKQELFRLADVNAEIRAEAERWAAASAEGLTSQSKEEMMPEAHDNEVIQRPSLPEANRP